MHSHILFFHQPLEGGSMPTAQLDLGDRPRVTSGPVNGVVHVALKGPDITSQMAEKFGNLAAEKAGTVQPVIRRMGSVFCYHFNGSNQDRDKWLTELKKLEMSGKILPKNTVVVSANELKFPEGGNAIRYNNI